MSVAPTPEQGQALTIEQISQLLREAGRQRYLGATATKIHTALHTEHLRALPAVARAFGASTRALVSIISELVRQISILASEVEENFGRHPDAKIYLSQPGLGTILGARALAEFGDDPHRYVNGKARRNYAGTFPVTRASGTKTTVLARYARNRRLGDALFQQAFAALTASPGARRDYDAMRARHRP